MIYGSADVAILVVNLLLVPVYTRVLSPTDYGALALLLVLDAFLRPLNHLGFDEAYLRFYFDGQRSERRQLTGTTVMFLLGSNLILLVALTSSSPWISRWLFGSTQYVSAIALLVMSRFVSAFFFIPFNLLRAENKSKQFATWTLCRSAGTVTARLALVVGLRLGVFGIMLADFIVSLVLLLGLSRVVRPVWSWSFSWPVARETLRYGLPRVPYALLHQTMGMSDRFFLRLFLPLSEVGVYSVGNTAATLVKFYSVSFGRAWSPFAFDMMRRPDARVLFGRMATYAFAVLVWSTLGVAIFAGPVVQLLTPPAFHRAAEVVPLLSVGIAMQSLTIFLSTSLNITKLSRAFPVTALFAAVATVSGHLILIPRLGIRGAAYAVVVGQIVLSIAMFVLSQRAYRIDYEVARLVKLAVIGFALYGVLRTTSLENEVLGFLLRLAIVAAFPVVVLAVGFLHREEWTQIKHMVAALRKYRRGVSASDGDVSMP